MPLEIEIDPSFINEIIDYFADPAFEKIQALTRHPAARSVYANVGLFQYEPPAILLFWEDTLMKEMEKGEEYIKNLLATRDYFVEKKSDFDQAFSELNEFIPPQTDLKCKLHLMCGYDIGIADKQRACLSIGHPIFQKNPRELLYFSMHELHHVVCFQYQPLITLSGIKTPHDIYELVRRATHLEG